MKKKLFLGFLIFLLFVVIITFTGASTHSDAASGKKLSVYTSFYIMQDFAKKIGGNKVAITNLVPAGTEPHDWEPTPKDIARLSKAEVFIYNGAGMEHWVGKVLKSLGNEKPVTVETAKGIKLIQGKAEHTEDELEDAEKINDPHVWLNPLFAKKQMEAIKNALVKADSVNKAYYEKNYRNNAKKIDELDRAFKETIQKCPRREIIVAHEAFGYLCNAYGLKQVGIEGLNADSEPTPTRMAEVIKFAKKHDVKVIFFEELLSPKVAEVIAREIGAKTEVLNPLEGLAEKDIKDGKEYFSVMRENLKALVKALK